MKYSNQREVIYNIVKRSCEHPTAEAIYEQARKEISNISLGTVYRNLKILSENGSILQIKGLGEKDHFDKTLYDHGHILCEECNMIYDIGDDSFKEIRDKVYKENGFEAKNYTLSITGICRTCREKLERGREYGITRN